MRLLLGDPVDRLLIATARLEKMTLVTMDGKILGYPHVQSLRRTASKANGAGFDIRAAFS
jgi:hypothetical protein